MTTKQFWKLEINPEEREDAKDLRRDSLFLAGFSLVCFGILLNFDPVQIKIFLDPAIGLRIHPWLFLCIVLFVTCSQICRRIKHYYEFILADFLYLLAILLLYLSLSFIVFRMRMDPMTTVAIIGSLGFLVFIQVLNFYSIIKSARHEMQ
ncbi:MAG: hypothetical protein NWF08_08335 [Candidatus Bathyarchaeota archaeon]|nr:hypothetical protein [Candidatus Bathyarchaeota archaeon]